ncbi:uncharacterized protein EI90DRAFT_2970358 [Cantharellus anzutake]|uniref:uncharacterized protein n=1 Tax=Cantharellus anzutake TaxID=1750568 RepID=UPI0019054794|nr:uncharacterized protein EI90DRAFT_2970358 [Cantharellus anzutake]KAF8334018.1 hypothetical protein EI90DRAFT_2970358 [Cantharellus anzutake]
MNKGVERVQAVFNCLKENNLTLASFLAFAISSVFFCHEIRAVENTMLFSTTPSREADIVREWILRSSRNIYEAEIRDLLRKETNLRMNASAMQMEQFEVARMRNLKDIYKTKAPMLWDLLLHLLNADSRTNKTRVVYPIASVAAATMSATENSDSTEGDHPITYDHNEALHLFEIKGVVIASILIHSSNEKCNALQVRNGLYLAASNASKSIRQWAAHTGLSVSPSSIANARDSLIKGQKELNCMLGATKVLNLAYDNCDFKFTVGQPTDLKDRTFESITTGLFLNMHNGVLPEDLEYAEYIWERHPNNEESTNPFPVGIFYRTWNRFED